MKHTTLFSSKEYDKKIKQTLPYYQEFYKQIIDVVKYNFNNKYLGLILAAEQVK